MTALCDRRPAAASARKSSGNANPPKPRAPICKNSRRGKPSHNFRRRPRIVSMGYGSRGWEDLGGMSALQKGHRSCRYHRPIWRGSQRLFRRLSVKNRGMPELQSINTAMVEKAMRGDLLQSHQTAKIQPWPDPMRSYLPVPAEPSNHDFSQLSISGQRAIDDLCNRFESEWQAGGFPRIRDYLSAATGPSASIVFRELFRIEL
jgi:hypothetical protein